MTQVATPCSARGSHPILTVPPQTPPPSQSLSVLGEDNTLWTTEGGRGARRGEGGKLPEVDGEHY